MIKSRQEWIASLRDLCLLPNSPVLQNNGKWNVAQRVEAWQAIGARIFDEHLDRFKNVAVDVLRENDPQFDLEPDQRYLASIHGKVLKHSHSLRKGLAETLALLGSIPEALTSCSHGKAEATAVLVVRDVLQGANWVRWASLTDLLPTLGEAAPNEFLNRVEEALNRDPSPLREVFAQEGDGLTGRNYMTGLLWALETLAWHPDYFMRAMVLLGELASIDPGGKWANRPFSSLVDILLPWHPQTAAGVPKRKAAMVALLREYPAIGWKLLLALLPSAHGSTSGTQKPTWRRFIPAGWSENVPEKEYREQVGIYAELTVDEAKSDPSKLSQLIERLPDLPDPAHSSVLGLLASDAILQLCELERLPLWEALLDLAGRHRRYADAQWAMPTELVTKIEEVAAKLAPKSASLIYRRLFSNRDYDLYDENGNWEEQQKKLDHQRQAAVKEILKENGVGGILDFARNVDSPEKVGTALGRVEAQHQDAVLIPELLNNDQKPIAAFVAGFVWGRYWTKGLPWVNGVITDAWTVQQKASLFTLLPFVPEAWRRADEILGDNATLYWKSVAVRPWGLKEELKEVVERLLQHHRPRAAVSPLYVMIHEKIAFSPDIAARVLMNSLKQDEKPEMFDQNEAQDIIKWLQVNPDTDRNALFEIEWFYLSLLDHHSGHAPQTLEQRLATDPGFFCEAIGLVFRSDKEERTDRQPTEKEKKIAQNAYRLLHGWHIVPGTAVDGSFDGSAFSKWLAEVKERTAGSGHLSIAMDQVGKVLAHAPSDPKGLWIHNSVADALNGKDADVMRSGFTCERFNMRGAHWDTRGKEELEIAADYQAKADALDQAGYQRIAAAVRELAKGYEREAERDSRRELFEK